MDLLAANVEAFRDRALLRLGKRDGVVLGVRDPSFRGCRSRSLTRTSGRSHRMRQSMAFDRRFSRLVVAIGTTTLNTNTQRLPFRLGKCVSVLSARAGYAGAQDSFRITLERRRIPDFANFTELTRWGLPQRLKAFPRRDRHELLVQLFQSRSIELTSGLYGGR